MSAELVSGPIVATDAEGEIGAEVEAGDGLGLIQAR